MGTKLGVALIDSANTKSPFGIVDNPLTEDEVPSALQRWRFADEYDALLVLALWQQYSKGKRKFDATLGINEEFKLTIVIPTFKILGLTESVWAKY